MEASPPSRLHTFMGQMMHDPLQRLTIFSDYKEFAVGIDHKDFMHGAALVAIADSDDFTALNKASVKYGHYVVNHDRHIFLKYNDGSGPGTYHFTFTASDKQQLQQPKGPARVYSVLICGDEVVTGIALAELDQLIDLNSRNSDAIKVLVAVGKQIRISSAKGRLDPIPRRSFPSRILNQA